MEKSEEILEKAGKWGKYQKIISLCVILTSLSLCYIILVLPLMHKPPEFTYYNGTDMIPILNKTEFCKNIYKSEPFDKLFPKLILDHSSSSLNWAYDLKIVCNTREIIALIGTVYFMASISSNLAFSKFGDMFGRKKIFLFLNFISFLSLIQLLYLKHISQLILTSFIMGVSSINLAIGSVIINENVDKNYSGLIMGLTNSMFPFGGLINLIFMYFFKNWNIYLMIIIVTLAFVNVLGIFYMKESPKWQYANQHCKDFINTVNAIAKINGKENNLVSSEIASEFTRRRSSQLKIGDNNEEYRKHVYDWYDLLKYPSLRAFTLKNIYLWIFTGFSFFGILLNLEGLTGNVYKDGIATYSAEIIAEIGSGAVLHCLGRRNTTLISFILSGFSCLIFTFIKIPFLEIIFLFMSAIGISSGFNVLYVYSAELYPTNVRSLSISLFSLFNRLSASTIPILLTFTSKITFVIGILSFIAFAVTFTLPESLNYDSGDEIKELRETMYEIEEEKESDENEKYLYFHEVFEMSF